MIVDNKDRDLFFHKDAQHVYSFGESVIPNGGVYGLRVKHGDTSNGTSKVTASRLVHIKTAEAFEQHIGEIAEPTYQNYGRRRVMRAELYTVNPCIVLVKEKMKKWLLLRR